MVDFLTGNDQIRSYKVIEGHLIGNDIITVGHLMALVSFLYLKTLIIRFVNSL